MLTNQRGEGGRRHHRQGSREGGGGAVAAGSQEREGVAPPRGEMEAPQPPWLGRGATEGREGGTVVDVAREREEQWGRGHRASVTRESATLGEKSGWEND